MAAERILYENVQHHRHARNRRRGGGGQPMKIFHRVFLAGVGVSTLYLALLAYPQPLFAHELTSAGITVHSSRPIPDAMRPTLERVRARLDRSPLHEGTRNVHVFICHSPWLFGL